jgi:hypothetical protein
VGSYPTILPFHPCKNIQRPCGLDLMDDIVGVRGQIDNSVPGSYFWLLGFLHVNSNSRKSQSHKRSDYSDSI